MDRARQLTTDNPFRVRDGSSEAVIHVEIERDWRPGIPRRLFGYASAAVMATALPVWSVVVLLRPGGRPPREGLHRIPGARRDAFVFRYQVVPLWQLEAQEMRAYLGPEGAPFCAAMHGADEALIGELADDVRTARGLPERDRQTTMQLLFLVSAAILGSEPARRIFHMESIIQDPNVQELIQEWEGKGRADPRAHDLLTVLQVRRIHVSAAARKRIFQEKDLKQLERWLKKAVVATSASRCSRQ